MADKNQVWGVFHQLQLIQVLCPTTGVCSVPNSVDNVAATPFIASCFYLPNPSSSLPSAALVCLLFQSLINVCVYELMNFSVVGE